jgi:hypothetical protein
MYVKGRRFTPELLDRWRKEKRGTGTGKDYIPWHQVRPADPASRGRSHLVNWRFDRLHHLLSDNEWVVFGLCTMLSNVVDLREQYPLALKPHPSDVSPYCLFKHEGWSAGTLEIAQDLNIAHPDIRSKGRVVPWVMTTDFVVTLAMPNGRMQLLAISVKESSEVDQPRTRELLAIEREYWIRQGCNWLLITPELCAPDVLKTLKSSLPWMLTEDDKHLWAQLSQLVPWHASLVGKPLEHALNLIADLLDVGCDRAQCLLWKSVGYGLLPLDLSSPVRPSAPLRLLSEEGFRRQNPVASRRTAWRN